MAFFLDRPGELSDGVANRQLEFDVALANLEAMVLTGNAVQALARAQALLETELTGPVRARLSLVAADANLIRSQPAPAAPFIASAIAIYRDSGDEYGVVECLDRDGYRRLLAQDAGAQEVFTEAIARCRALDPCPGPLLSRILSHAGSWSVQAHDWRSAITLFAEAIEVAGSMRDLRRMGQMYSDLAAAHQQLGDPQQALRYAHKALAMQEARSDDYSVVRAENNLGMTLLRAGDPAAAQAHVNRALELSREVGYAAGEVHVLLSLAEVRLAGGDPDSAEQAAEDGIALARQQGEHMSLALGHRLLGEVAGARHDLPGVRRHFDTALDALGEGGDRERLIETHEAYGRALEALGQDKEALRHMRQALSLSRPQFEASAEPAGSDALADLSSA
ncbi:MAG: hypothetical protein QOK05_1531 [Chloroflexota bacterium]|jgi:tetratricopeptide (TPR) repeat protein|nr:hypothetical protein [Chloroflexota bacterium]